MTTNDEIKISPVDDFPNYYIAQDGNEVAVYKIQKLKAHKNRNGYLKIRLNNGKHRVYRMIHRLVASAFIKKIPPGHEVNHNDKDRLNNFDYNLEVITKLANIHHRDHYKKELGEDPF